uniref:Uncharacterized protein n=1 Tax=Picea glauca TaxID=3330 RepID=A0A101M338_PICGL|nr:hypothetical protein ABT39_MTgene3247 [Picea glauca]
MLINKYRNGAPFVPSFFGRVTRSWIKSFSGLTKGEGENERIACSISRTFIDGLEVSSCR